MKDSKKTEFRQLMVEEMESVQGGWKLFGREEVAVDGTNCQRVPSGCTQDWERTTYVFGIPFNKTINKGCSNMLSNGTVAACNGCGYC
jgi:hypothetical protein